MRWLLCVLLGVGFGYTIFVAGESVAQTKDVELASCEADWLALVHTDEGRGALVVRLTQLRVVLEKLKVEEHLPAPFEKKEVLMYEAEQLENLLMQYQQAPEAKKRR